jgi:hypothetical protein
MTRALVAIERFFERLFERPATRLFHPRLQPVQLQRRLERAMEAERRLSADRTYVPDRYRIVLHPNDHEQFAGYRGTLESDLSDALLARARKRGYTLLARPSIRLEASREVRSGEILVEAEVLDPGVLREVSTGLRRVDGMPIPRRPPGAAGTYAGSSRAAGSSPQRDLSATAAFEAPRVPAPTAIIEIAGPGTAPHRVSFVGGTLRIGRGPENDIVLTDERVSRRHGAFTTRQGALIYTDQGSTNGSFVNGSMVSEIALGTGDVVRLGNTTLTIRPDR